MTPGILPSLPSPIRPEPGFATPRLLPQSNPVRRLDRPLRASRRRPCPKLASEMAADAHLVQPRQCSLRHAVECNGRLRADPVAWHSRRLRATDRRSLAARAAPRTSSRDRRRKTLKAGHGPPLPFSLDRSTTPKRHRPSASPRSRACRRKNRARTPKAPGSRPRNRTGHRKLTSAAAKSRPFAECRPRPGEKSARWPSVPLRGQESHGQTANTRDFPGRTAL